VSISIVRGPRILALLGIASVLLFAACGTSTLSLSATEIIAKAKDATSKSLKDAKYSLNLTIDTTTSGAKVSVPATGNGIITANPSRTYSKVSLNLLGTTIDTEIITDGSTSYTKNGGATVWTKSTGNSSSSSLFGATGNFLDISIQNPVLVGHTMINGVDTYHISGKVITTPTAGSTTPDTTSEDLYIRTDNFYLDKISSVTTSTTSILPTGGAGSNTPTTLTITVQFSDWNKGTKIDLPPSDQVQG